MTAGADERTDSDAPAAEVQMGANNLEGTARCPDAGGSVDRGEETGMGRGRCRAQATVEAESQTVVVGGTSRCLSS